MFEENVCGIAGKPGKALGDLAENGRLHFDWDGAGRRETTWGGWGSCIPRIEGALIVTAGGSRYATGVKRWLRGAANPIVLWLGSQSDSPFDEEGAKWRILRFIVPYHERERYS